MAGIAPLSGSTATTINAVPPAPDTAVPVAPPPGNKHEFTAFPSSYSGFGADGGAYGTIGFANGKLSVVAAPQAAGTSADGQPGQTGQAGRPDSSQAQAGSLPGSTPPGDPPSDPTQGLLGAAPANAIPGSPAPAPSPTAGLLGTPATNPIVIQAEQQEQNAAEEAQAAAAAAAAQQAAAALGLQQVNQRISAAYATNNQAAVQQLQPAQVKLQGQISGSPWAGLGTTPPLPFKLPEIPTVFLNIPA